MSKTFVYDEDTEATLTVELAGDVVLDGKWIVNGVVEEDWDHADFEGIIGTPII